MITYRTGNLFESTAEALVNTVNTVGVMGKGIALQFKKLFPSNYKVYYDRCKAGDFEIGDMLVTEDSSLITGPKIIINFPTKRHWRKPSEYTFIEQGVARLKELIVEKDIKSIAIPPLGAGNGGLEWYKVREILEESLLSLHDCDIIIYEPNANVKEILNQERVILTDARALLLFVLYNLVRNGEFVSEFACEKICYFLQRFGASKIFKLDYAPNYYGPYSGKVRHLLYRLNGSYIKGYEGKDKKPFEYLSLIMEAQEDVINYVKKDPELLRIATLTTDFLEGYYSSFGLELLSTVDFVSQKSQTNDANSINASLEKWSDRKRSLFSNDGFIEKSLNHLQGANLI